MTSPDPHAAFRELKFRDPVRARAMIEALGRLTAAIAVHRCR